MAEFFPVQFGMVPATVYKSGVQLSSEHIFLNSQ